MLDQTIEPDRLLTSTEVGDLLQVNPSSVKKWVNEGRIVAFRTPGGHRRIRAADLVQFLEEHQIPVPDPLQSAGRRRLLIVDDDQTLLSSLARSLKRFDTVVTIATFTSGIDALVHIGSFRPHLVLLDIFMPEVDGLEVCRRLRANPDTAGTKVLIASANLTPELEKQAYGAGAQRCTTKPVDPQWLMHELGVRLGPLAELEAG